MDSLDVSMAMIFGIYQGDSSSNKDSLNNPHICRSLFLPEKPVTLECSCDLPGTGVVQLARLPKLTFPLR